ncbi:MAG: 3-deoxy-manno-octulosonate cytidylyltransferase [Flavobacteriaceae bacterium]
MKIAAVIPARLDSMRLPNKLLRDICGKSLIIRTYESTLNSKVFDEVYVVTNNKDIVSELERNNANYFFEDKQYETGTDRIAGIASKINTDIIINVQGDEPFIKSKTLTKIINVFKEDKNKSIQVVSVMTPIDKNEISNPNNVKVVTDVNNYAMYFSRFPIPYDRDERLTSVYKHVGIYAFRKETLLSFSRLNTGELESIEKIEALRLLENEIRIKMIISNEVFIGVDTEEDLIKAIKLINEKKSV